MARYLIFVFVILISKQVVRLVLESILQSNQWSYNKNLGLISKVHICIELMGCLMKDVTSILLLMISNIKVLIHSSRRGLSQNSAENKRKSCLSKRISKKHSNYTRNKSILLKELIRRIFRKKSLNKWVLSMKKLRRISLDVSQNWPILTKVYHRQHRSIRKSYWKNIQIKNLYYYLESTCWSRQSTWHKHCKWLSRCYGHARLYRMMWNWWWIS